MLWHLTGKLFLSDDNKHQYRGCGNHMCIVRGGFPAVLTMGHCRVCARHRGHQLLGANVFAFSISISVLL